MPPSQQLAMYKERCERMQAEANDMQRRLKEKDEKAVEQQRLLTTAQQRSSKGSETLAVEHAERMLLEQSFSKAESEAKELRSQLETFETRAYRAEASNER